MITFHVSTLEKKIGEFLGAYIADSNRKQIKVNTKQNNAVEGVPFRLPLKEKRERNAASIKS